MCRVAPFAVGIDELLVGEGRPAVLDGVGQQDGPRREADGQRHQPLRRAERRRLGDRDAGNGDGPAKHRDDPIRRRPPQHGFHHRHLMGVVEPVKFKSFEDIEERFQADWIAFRSKK